VRVAAAVNDDTLSIEVSDDGPGADRRAVLAASGLGLRSLRQRMLALHGDRAGIHVETEPGRGFLIRLTLPAAAMPQRAALPAVPPPSVATR
jgi:signal transduction histidine kinase